MAVGRFGKLIRERRRQLNLTQEQVARRLGVSTPYVGHLEASKRRPSLRTVGRLAGVLGFKESELYLVANPEAAALLRPTESAQSPSTWSQFKRVYLTAANVAQDEIDVLSRVASMGPVQSPRDFLYLLNSVRQTLGR